MAELPAALRLPIEADRLEAGGRRAHVVEIDGALRVSVGSGSTLIRLHPPLAPGRTGHWPFAAERAGVRVFAATDQPVAFIERSLHAGETQRIRVEHDAAVVLLIDGAVRGESDIECGASVRITLHARELPQPDVDALLGGSIARARRRASQRLRVVRAGEEEDAVAVQEHRLRLRLTAGTDLDARARTVAALALLAVNDPKAAADILEEGEAEIARDATCAVVLAGAWSAWRGSAVPSNAVRVAARAWRADAAGGAWARAARALAPFSADVLGDQHAREPGDAPEDDPARAIAALAEAAPPGPAGALLRLVHGELGIVPDAVRARVRIAPALVAGRLRVEQLAVGDAAFLCDAEVTDAKTTIDLEQTQGATPFTAILEPRVPGRRLREALVEDTPAELDATDDEGGIRPRVQLIIDRKRRVVLNYERR